MLNDAYITTRREAIRAVRAEADYLIDCMERMARGWDQGMYRNNDVLRQRSARAQRSDSVAFAFRLSRRFAGAQQ